MNNSEHRYFRKIADFFRIDEKDLVTFFQRDRPPDHKTERKLFIIGALLMPITFGGMLLGFIRGYRKFMFPFSMQPDFSQMPRSVKTAMILGGVLIWVILFSGFILLILLFKILFDTYFLQNFYLLLTYLGINLGGCLVFWGMFKNWRTGVEKYLFEQSKFGTARYAEEWELAPYKNRKGFFIGEGHGFADKGHILTVAGTRSGKFVGLIAPNLLGVGGYEDSWVVIDPKGEATAVTARYQMNQDNRRVVILNPWGEHKELLGDTDAYNPLDILTDRESIHLVDDAGMIAEMIIPVEKADKDKFFADNARAILTGLLLHLVTTSKKKTDYKAPEKDDAENEDMNGATSGDYYRDEALKEAGTEDSGIQHSGPDVIGAHMQDNKDKEHNETPDENREDKDNPEEPEDSEVELSLKTIWEWIRLPKKEWEKLLEDMRVNDDEVNGDIVKKSGNEIMKLMSAGERTFGIIMAYLLQATDFIKSPSLQKAMESEFDPKTLSDGNVTLYVIIPADKLVSHFRWLRLVITTMMRAVVRNKNKRVCFLLDEFAALGYMPEIEVALSTYAGYNITVWPILQSLIQLSAVYEKGWETFIGNTAVKQFFGVNDNFTAEYVSQAIGMASHTKAVRNFFRIREVVANERLLVTPDEVRRGSGSRMFVFIQSLPVTVFNKQVYYMMSELYNKDQPRFDANPYYPYDLFLRYLGQKDREAISQWLAGIKRNVTILIEVEQDDEAIQFAGQITSYLTIKRYNSRTRTVSVNEKFVLPFNWILEPGGRGIIRVYRRIYTSEEPI